MRRHTSVPNYALRTPQTPPHRRCGSTLSQNTDGDLVVELSVPTGYCHVAEITETGLRIVVADIGTDCCRHCGEHFSNPHIPGCPASDS